MAEVWSQTKHGVLREEHSNLGYLSTLVLKSVSLLLNALQYSVVGMCYRLFSCTPNAGLLHYFIHFSITNQCCCQYPYRNLLVGTCEHFSRVDTEKWYYWVVICGPFSFWWVQPLVFWEGELCHILPAVCGRTCCSSLSLLPGKTKVLCLCPFHDWKHGFSFMVLWLNILSEHLFKFTGYLYFLFCDLSMNVFNLCLTFHV